MASSFSFEPQLFVASSAAKVQLLPAMNRVACYCDLLIMMNELGDGKMSFKIFVMAAATVSVLLLVISGSAAGC
jgi:hypothetical protein